MEIVDHHRVGDIETAGPILFLNLPVGSTATIVALRYEQLGVEIPEAMAGHPARRAAHRHRDSQVADDDRERTAEYASACRAVEVDPLGFGMEVLPLAVGRCSLLG